MKNSEFPEIPAAALRDNATSARVERVWRRLEVDLGGSPSRPRSVWWWAPAAVAIVFGAGVFVGARWSRSEAPAAAALLPEPEIASEPGLPAQDQLGPAPQPRMEAPRAARSRPARAPQPSSPLVTEVPAVADSIPAPVVSSAAPPAGPPEWQQLFDQGEFDAARYALEQRGDFAAGFDAALAVATPEQAVSLADIAVFTGDRTRAVVALRRVVNGAKDDPVAPLAAYKLGNLLEKMGDRAGAAEAFANYRRLSPTGDLAEDALARQVDVALERGDVELARRLAEQYAQDFPNGRRLPEFREHLQKLSGAAAPGAAADAGAVPAPADDVPAEEPVDEDRAGSR